LTEREREKDLTETGLLFEVRVPVLLFVFVLDDDFEPLLYFVVENCFFHAVFEVPEGAVHRDHLVRLCSDHRLPEVDVPVQGFLEDHVVA